MCLFLLDEIDVRGVFVGVHQVPSVNPPRSFGEFRSKRREETKKESPNPSLLSEPSPGK
jgi:hypothetical protein